MNWLKPRTAFEGAGFQVTSSTMPGTQCIGRTRPHEKLSTGNMTTFTCSYGISSSRLLVLARLQTKNLSDGFVRNITCQLRETLFTENRD
jgi:hypothetical protein